MPAVEFSRSRRVREITYEGLTYANTTSLHLFTLPDDARIIMWVINVETAFVDGTTTIDIGTSADPDYYVDGESIAAVGNVALGAHAVRPGAETTEPGSRIYANVGASNTAGSLDLTCIFSYQKDTPL